MSTFLENGAAAWWAWLAPAAWHATWIGVFVVCGERIAVHRLAPAYRAALWWLFFASWLVPSIVASPLSVRETVEAAITPWSSASYESPLPLVALASLWLVGVCACAARLALGHARGLRALAVGSRPANTTLAREGARLAARVAPKKRVTFHVSPRIASPAVIGLFRPRVYLPERFAASPREREHALLHELTHVARRDVARALVVELLCALFWFHPLAWFGARRLALARELACDARVTALLGEEADAYRATLAHGALLRVDARAIGALGLLGGARIVERLRALERRPRLPHRQHAALASALFLVGCVTLLPAAVNPTLELRAVAQRVLDSASAGERTSCFTLHAAALALRDESSPSTPAPTE
ncbi:MAG: M56 family metallopeptidase [Planctomycetes bacterium]|nr:M56 family metallopeptidase [Planctomycetota bacterium]